MSSSKDTSKSNPETNNSTTEKSNTSAELSYPELSQHFVTVFSWITSLNQLRGKSTSTTNTGNTIIHFLDQFEGRKTALRITGHLSECKGCCRSKVGVRQRIEGIETTIKEICAEEAKLVTDDEVKECANGEWESVVKQLQEWEEECKFCADKEKEGR